MTCNKPKIIKKENIVENYVCTEKGTKMGSFFFSFLFLLSFFFLFSVLVGRELQMHDDSETFIHNSSLTGPLLQSLCLFPHCLSVCLSFFSLANFHLSGPLMLSFFFLLLQRAPISDLQP